jgi:hypothetical protein
MKIINYVTNNRMVFSLAVVFFLFFVVVMSNAGIAEPKKAKSNQEAELFPPKNIMSIIKKIYPTCNIVTLSDLADEAKSEFLGMYPHGNPGWVKGDFNGDGFVDYALLLSNKEKDTTYLRLVVLLSSGNKFTVKNLVSKFEGDSFWYISLMPAGTVVKHTEAFAPINNEPNEIKLKYPAVEYFKAGSFMSVFYFENGEFHSIPVTD